MNNCTLIIDGNWLLMSRLGLVMHEFAKDQAEGELNQASDNLVDFLAQSVNKIINFFDGNIDNIIMVQDGGSWRKKFPKPKLYTDEYKGNRVKDDSVNWSYIWKALDQFCKNFHSNNITCTQEYSIEGDDWIWYWTRWLNSNDCNAIIWSSDCDLKQLIQVDPTTNRWTAWFNERAGLVVHKQFDYSGMSLVDSFFNFDLEDPQLNSLIDNVKRRGHAVNYINPEDIAMEKIVCGDSGDNIKALMRVQRGTRTYRVSEKEWAKAKEELNINSLEELKTRCEDLIKYLRGLKRFSTNADSLDDLTEMFIYNFHMVVLDEEYIPSEQKQLMEAKEGEYKQADMLFIKNNYKVLGAQTTVNIEDIFNGIE